MLIILGEVHGFEAIYMLQIYAKTLPTILYIYI